MLADGRLVTFVGLVAERYDAIVVQDDMRSEVALGIGVAVVAVHKVAARADDLDCFADAERGQFADPLSAHDLALEAGRQAAAIRVVSSLGTHNEEEILYLLGSHADPVVDDLDVESLVGHDATRPSREKLTHWGADRNVGGIGVVCVCDQFGYDSGHLVVKLDAQLVDRKARNPHRIVNSHARVLMSIACGR